MSDDEFEDAEDLDIEDETSTTRTSSRTTSTRLTTTMSTSISLDDDIDARPRGSRRRRHRRRRSSTEAAEEEDDDVVDLDEELHPDDVEEPLDVLLQERTASATLEDDEEELEEDEGDADDRGDGPTQIVPRRAGEFLCSSCFLVLPRNQLADEKAALPRLRLTLAQLAGTRLARDAQASRGRARRPARWHVARGQLLRSRRSISVRSSLVALVPLLWTWRDAHPRHAALYGFAFGVGLLRRGARVDPLLRCRRDRAARRDRWRSSIAIVGALVGALRAARHRVTVADRGGLGRPRSAARTRAARRVRVGRRSASRCTTSRRHGRSRASAACRS